MPHRYLAIYEVETDDLDAAHAALTAADLPARALAPATVVAYFRPMTERRTAP